MKRNRFRLNVGVTRLVTSISLLVTCWLSTAVAAYAQREEEARAIADTLIVIAAERHYAALNCGYFADLTNLCQPDVGLLSYPIIDPGFITLRLGKVSPYLESGYVRNFTRNLRPPMLSHPCDPESTIFFCYDSTPYDAGTGLPSFSGTESGELYFDATGSPIPCLVPQGTAKLSLPSIVSPPPGSRLTGPSVTVRWTQNDVPVSEWRLTAGSAGSPPSVGEYYDSGYLGTSLSTEVTNLPLDSGIVHFRLWFRVADLWTYSDFRYLSATTGRRRRW